MEEPDMFSRKRTGPVAHDDLVRAAPQVIGTDGPIAVGRERLARELRVDPQAIDADIDAVTAEAYRGLSAAEFAQVRRTILADPSPAQQMRALLSWLATPPVDSDGIRLEAWALARHNPALKQAVQDGEAAWHGLAASVVRRGARSNEFLQADADEIAAHVISLIDGINAYQMIGYRSDFDRMVLLTRVLKAELGLAWGPGLDDALEVGPR